MRKKSEAYRDAAGRLVGRRAGRTFVRGAHDRHFLKRPPAVSLDAAVCERIFAECDDLRVINLDTGAVYGITVDEFRARMRRLDRGFGDQYMVALQYWRLIAPPISDEDESPRSAAPSEPPDRSQPRLI